MFTKTNDSRISKNGVQIIPDEIAHKYCLRFERNIGLMDSKGGVYCCDVEQIDARSVLTRGWDQFMEAVGAAVGDYFVFDVKGADETIVWLFRYSVKHLVCAGAGSSFGAGECNIIE